MKRFLILPSLLAAIFLLAPAAHADSLTLTGVGNQSFAGTSAGPYSATLNGNSITMVCVSFDRTVTVGQTWQVTVNSLNAAGVALALYGAQENALLNYQRAAWLYDQMTINPNEAGAIQGAIWNVFNGGTPDTNGSNHWLTLAMSQDLSNYDFSRFRILTPTDFSASGAQENLTTIPEPATMLLLGTGIAGFAAARRRRNKRNDSETEAA